MDAAQPLAATKGKSENAKVKGTADFPNDAGKQTSGNNAGAFTDYADFCSPGSRTISKIPIHRE
jgi:hypothetical protein